MQNFSCLSRSNKTVHLRQVQGEAGVLANPMMRITARLFSVIDQFVDHSLADFRSRWGEIGAEF